MNAPATFKRLMYSTV